jgi:hypothetical protein
MDYEDLLKIQKKKETGEKLTFEEVKYKKIKTQRIYLKYHSITDYPKQRGNILLFRSETQFEEILKEGKPV